MFWKMQSSTSCICIFLAITAAVFADDCDKKKCKGPLRFYEDINCKPIYEKPGDCCASRYDCSHLNSRSTNKCYANGKEYAVGDQLKNEDRSSPCDIACVCRDFNEVASFSCAAVDCPPRPVKPGCYLKKSLDSCCPDDLVCPENLDEVVKCEVEGKTYYDGQAFYPSGDQPLVCQCASGYEGKNVEPFCKKITCGTELHHSRNLHEKCVPVYYSAQPPTTSCSVSYRCQNLKDELIKGSDDSKAVNANDDMKCKFGNILMNVGDELNQATDYSSVCVKCTCEVPPTPTCQRLPDEECDVTKHPKFDNFEN